MFKYSRDDKNGTKSTAVSGNENNAEHSNIRRNLMQLLGIQVPQHTSTATQTGLQVGHFTIYFTIVMF